MAKFVPRKPVTAARPHPVAKPVVVDEADPSERTFLGGPVRAVSMVTYGTEGVGKTSFAAHFPRCGFICDSRERRIEILSKLGQVPKPMFIKIANTWEDVLNLLDEVSIGNLECDNLAIDATTGLQTMCFDYHCKKEFGNKRGNDGFMAYQKGPDDAAQFEWPKLFTGVQQCVDAGISVNILGHSEVKTFKNPEGKDYDHYAPSLHAKLWGPLVRFVDMVLFMNTFIDVTAAQEKDRKGKGSTDIPPRMLYTQRTDLWVAKNCFNLSAVINCGLSPQEAFERFKADYLK